MKNKEDYLKAQINISKISLNAWHSYSLTHSIDWIKELLDEMSENASTFTRKIFENNSFLKIDIEINKKLKPHEGEMLLVKGSIDAIYATECVKSLKPMLEPLQFSFKACFLNQNLEKDEQYAEVDEVFEEGDVYQVYFFSRNHADLKEMIHEQIYLHYNSYPAIDTEKNNALSNAKSEDPTDTY
jgi:hypothetical protein